jgi:hypothetical protein
LFPLQWFRPVFTPEALPQNFYPPLGIRQLLMKPLAQGNALLEAGKRVLEAQVAILQLLDQGFQPVQAVIEGGGIRRHGL